MATAQEHFARTDDTLDTNDTEFLLACFRMNDMEPVLIRFMHEPEIISRTLREHVVAFQKNGGPFSKEKSQRFLKFIDDISQEAQSMMVACNHDQDFEATWQYARLLHRLGRAKEAYTHTKIAEKHDPDHAKLLAREVETLLDLHQETPKAGHNYVALLTALDVIRVEDSEYTARLLATVEETIDPEELEKITDRIMGNDNYPAWLEDDNPDLKHVLEAE